MTEPPAPSRRFQISPRQRRLRTINVVLLLLIAVLVAVGVTHPAFRMVAPPVLTEVARKALAVKGVLILAYWSLCFALLLLVIFLAWLDVREINRQLAIARSDILRQMAEQVRQRTGKSDPT